jgi:hypothetical protein
MIDIRKYNCTLFYKCFGWLLAVWLAAGCSKDVDVFVPDAVQPAPDTLWVNNITDTMPVAVLKKELLLSVHTDSVDAGAGDTVIAPLGAKFYLPAGIVTNAAGAAINGKVKLELMHITKNGDLIRMNKPTSNQGKIFASGGIVFAQLSKYEQALQLKDGKTATITMPTQTTLIDSLKIHFGDGSGLLEYNWLLNYDSANTIVNESAAYRLQSHRLGWIGSGKFYTTYAPVTVHVKLPSQFTNANSFVSLVVDGKLCMANCYGQPLYKRFVAYGLPGAQAATLVVLSKIGNRYFAAKKSIVLQPGVVGTVVVQSENVTPVLSSPSAVNSLLNSL